METFHVMTIAKALRLLLLAIGATALSGCWYHSHYRHGPPYDAADVVYIRLTPPPPRKMRPPPRPHPQAVWIDGYWRWDGARYQWNDGRWELHPPPGRVWSPGQWIHTSRGWHWMPGRWR